MWNWHILISYRFLVQLQVPGLIFRQATGGLALIRPEKAGQRRRKYLIPPILLREISTNSRDKSGASGFFEFQIHLIWLSEGQMRQSQARVPALFLEEKHHRSMVLKTTLTIKAEQ